MTKKQVTMAVAVLGLALAAGLAWWVQNRPVTASVEGGAVALSGTGSGAALGAGAGAAAAAGRPASGASGGAGPGGGGAGGGGPVVVEAGKVTRMRLETDATAVGSLRSNQGVMMRPEVSGRIVKLGFAEGQRVQRGQLLVQLDDTLQQAQVRQAEAQASIARTNLQRSRDLLAQNFVSQSAVDQNGAALEVAQAQVALAQAQLVRMRVLAPFDGITGLRSVNVGDYVKDGADLVGIEDMSSVWVDFRLPERYLGLLKPGQAVALTLDAVPDAQYPARVVALDAQLDANGRSVLVRARLQRTDAGLRSGMFARARVVFSVREAALVVPEEALVPQGDKQFVIKLVPGDKGLVSQKVLAQIGQRAAGKVEMLAGLAEGDTVALAGQARLMRTDGLPVRVVDLNRPAGARGPGAGVAASGPGRAASGTGSGASSAGGTGRAAVAAMP